jgi:pyruvate kinase
MIRERRTRIVATLGPASRVPAMVAELASTGVDVFRLNFSHGSHEEHARAMRAVRAAEAEVRRPLAVLADLQGPKFRLGVFEKGHIAIAPGRRLRLDLDPAPGDARRVGLPHPEVLQVLKAGTFVVLDDGRTRLRVRSAGPGFVVTEVVNGETLSDHKGLAVPGVRIPVPAMTSKDRADLDFALRIGVDWVALSFVQRAPTWPICADWWAAARRCWRRSKSPPPWTISRPFWTSATASWSRAATLASRWRPRRCRWPRRPSCGPPAGAARR